MKRIMIGTSLRYAGIGLVGAFLLFSYNAKAQCPQIEAIMIDACGPEQFNEFVIIHSGGGFNTADIELDFDANNNFAGPQNNDINTNNGNWPANPTPCGLTAGNIGAYSGCPNLIAVGPGVNIPPNAIVVLQTSIGSTNSNYNFSSLCGAGQCVFVISSACARSGGAFTNGGGSGTRTTNFSIAGGCNQSITYDLQQVPSGNGTYMLPLTGTFGNDGCVAPPASAPFMPPSINPIANVTACGSYTLPPIAGTNLTPNAAYFTGTNGTGTQYNPGDVITTTTTLYAFDSNGPGCSDQEQFTVTIVPLPTVNNPGDQVACSGQPVSVVFTGSPGATYSWVNSNPAIGLAASGSGNINFTAANVGSSEVGVIEVTPTSPAGCVGASVSFTITVNPGPEVNNPGDQEVCAGQAVSVVFSSPSGNPTYSWTNSNPGIGLAAAGSGNISFTASSPSSPQVGTITVVASEGGCTGPSQVFTITVHPAAVVNAPGNEEVCSGQPVSVVFTGSSGATYSWVNSNPAIGLAASGAGDIDFTAANVSSSEVGVIEVTPTSPAGCVGASVSFTITVNPNPVMDTPADQSVCGGDAVSVVFSSPSGTPTYNWVNSNPAIGLPPTGNGNISFTASNPANPQTATITVTPTLNGCTGTAQTFVISVTPRPVVHPVPNQTVCGSQNVVIAFSGTSGAVFDWTNSNPAIGLPPSGTGNISFTAANPSNAETAVIEVTPRLGDCTGSPISFALTVNPTPAMDPVDDVSACAGEFISVVFSSPSDNPTYSWVNSNPAIGLGANGVGNIAFTAANTGSPQTGVVTVTPQLGGCIGSSVAFSVSVSPAPTMSQPANVSTCGGSAVEVTFVGTPGAIFEWTNDNPNIGLAPNGSGNIAFVSANPEAVETATVVVTPVLNGCAGPSRTFSITVRPMPEVVFPGDRAVCGGDPVSVVFESPFGNPTYGWTNSNPAIGLGPSGVGNIGFTSAVVAAPQVAEILVTPSQGGCTGAPVLFTIVVSPTPTATPPEDVEACSGQTQTIALSGSLGASFSWTNDNTATGIAASGSGSSIAFTAANVSAPEISFISVTPVIGSCSGPTVSFVVIVRPTPTADAVSDQVACAGESVFIDFSGSPGATFVWTNSLPDIGLPAQGAGNISFIASAVSTPTTAQITVTPELAGCLGTPQFFTVTVVPAAVLPKIDNREVCSGDTVSILLSAPGLSVSWNNDNPAIGLPISGTGDLWFVAESVSAVEEALIGVTVVADTGSCPEASTAFKIRVKPIVSVENPGDRTVCAGDSVVLLLSNGQVRWSNDNPAIGLPTTGEGHLIFRAAEVASAESADVILTPLLPQGYAYVPNALGYVSVIDLANQAVVAGIPVNVGAYGVTVSRDGSRVYVATGPGVTPGALIAIDPTTNAVVGSAPIASPVGIFASPDGSEVYIAHAGISSLSVVDAQTLAVKAVVPLNQPISGGGVARSDGAAVYIGAGGAIQVVQLPGYVPTEIPLPSSDALIRGLDIDPSDQFLYGAYDHIGDSDSLWVLSLQNQTATSVWVGSAPNGVVFNAATGRVYVACENSNHVAVVDPAAGTLVTTIPVVSAPIGIDVLPNGQKVYAACLSGDVYVIDAAENTIDTVVRVEGAATAFGRFIVPASVCLGPDQHFRITVLPKPTLAPMVDVSACGGQHIDLVFSPSAGATVQWTNSNPAIGLSATGTGNLSFVSAIVTEPQMAVITAIPFAGDCTGDPVSFNVLVLPGTSDTVFVDKTTCDPAEVNTTVETFANQYGCDSVVVTTTALLPLDTVFLTRLTCDAGQVGTVVETFTNQYGCDSVVVTATVLAPLDTVFLTRPTCDAGQVGTVVETFTNQYGCDSVVVTAVVFDPSGVDTTALTVFTCDASQVGTVVETFTNQYGCDSVVVTSVVLAPLDTVFLTRLTCDVGQVGTVVETFANQYGCDSVVVTVVTFDPTACAPVAIISARNPFCAGENSGAFSVEAQSGQPPLSFSWVGTSGNSGSGQLPALLMPASVENLPAGMYTVTLSDANGATVVLSVQLTAPPALAAEAKATTNYGGFGVRCADSADGAAQVISNGGTPPYTYLWSTGDTLASLSGLGVGTYSVQVRDANGCTTSAALVLTAPQPLLLSWKTGIADCRDTLVDVSVEVNGGVAPYLITLNGNAVGGPVPSLPAGIHVLSVSDANGCRQDSAVAIALPPPPAIYLPPDTSVVLGNAITIEATTNLTQWQRLVWNPLPDSTCPNCLVQRWTPKRTQYLTVTITDENGCIASARMLLRVVRRAELYIPNAFRPQGVEGSGNHIWRFSAGPSVVEVREVAVFDRWGDQLYGWTTPIAPDQWPGWDGTTRGQKAGPGVYVYYVRVLLADGTEEILKGDVTIVE